MDASPHSTARLRVPSAPALLASVLLFAVVSVPAPSTEVRVEVEGREYRIASKHATVADALEVAGVRPHVGLMRSAATGNPLDTAIDPAVVLRKGLPVQLSTPIASGDELTVRNGADWIEPTVTKRVTRAGSPLPAVETQLWRQSHDGVVEQVVGEASAEVVQETVIEAPVHAVRSEGLEVVLTFDDGPDPRWTPVILDILRDKGAKAVFCVVGMQMRRHPELVRRVHDEGHVLCNHTELHDARLPSRPEQVIRSQIDSVSALIQQTSGTPPRFYRAPGGVLSDFVINYVRGNGMRVLGWSLDPRDYRKPGPEEILLRITTGIQPGGVVLMHDAGGDRSQTVAQLPALIDQLRAAGYAIAVP